MFLYTISSVKCDGYNASVGKKKCFFGVPYRVYNVLCNESQDYFVNYMCRLPSCSNRLPI